jgi:methylmalonyl-CoA/ethylmalonyl-CoA epimerase
MAVLPALWHVGIVVRDLDAAIADYERRYGLTVAHRLTLAGEGVLRGEQIAFETDLAFLSLGNTDIELVSPRPGPSPYARQLDEHGEGFHHLAFIVESIDEHLAQLGGEAEVVMESAAPNGVRFVYVEGTAHGVTIELLENPNGVSLFPEA